MTERVIEIVGFQRFTRDKLGDDYDVNGMRLRRKRTPFTQETVPINSDEMGCF